MGVSRGRLLHPVAPHGQRQHHVDTPALPHRCYTPALTANRPLTGTRWDINGAYKKGVASGADNLTSRLYSAPMSSMPQPPRRRRTTSAAQLPRW